MISMRLSVEGPLSPIYDTLTRTLLPVYKLTDPWLPTVLSIFLQQGSIDFKVKIRVLQVALRLRFRFLPEKPREWKALRCQYHPYSGEIAQFQRFPGHSFTLQRLSYDSY